MENRHAINGQIHYFDWAMASIAFCLFTRGYPPQNNGSAYIVYPSRPSNHPEKRMPHTLNNIKYFQFSTFRSVLSPVMGSSTHFPSVAEVHSLLDETTAGIFHGEFQANSCMASGNQNFQMGFHQNRADARSSPGLFSRFCHVVYLS